jgi:hypothetical protein
MANAAPQEKYKQEQEALARKHDGKEITIEAPKEPEVNPEVYRDVEPLLFRGFLTVPAQIGGALFVFKSLNHHEFEMIRLSGFLERGAYKYWDMLLAYNVFMIDGQNVLADRDRLLPKISDTFRDMELKVKQHIIRQMSEVNRRANNAVLLTECYAMEAYSRYRWAQLKELDLCAPTATGVPGSDRLGMNWAQLTWRALNFYEDRHETVERDWENAKFIGSCFAGKGIQKIYQQDTDRRQKEKEERFTRKDRLLRQVLLGEKPQDKVKQLHGAVLTGAHSVEELADQLQSDLRGEKDWHDRVVEEHTQRIKKNIQTRQGQVQALALRNEEEFGGHKVIGSTDFRGLNAQEVQERITRRKQLEAQEAARRMTRPEILTDPKSAEFLDKWGITNSEVNFQVEETDRDPSAAVPITPPKQGGTPFGRK